MAVSPTAPDPPRVMGVVNVTPDSFSDGGLFLDPERAIAHGRELAAEGADLLDVGGESTRPGAEAVSAAVELERVGPVVEALARPGGAGPAVSIDTSKAAVARGGARPRRRDRQRRHRAARRPRPRRPLRASAAATVVLMHMQGEPADDAGRPALRRRRRRRPRASSPSGSRPRSPPGSTRGGSGSTRGSASARRSSTTSSCCGAWASSRELGRPIVIGTSRKRFLGAITGREVGERLGGTVASNVLALAAGADVFRVHDVAATRQALDAAEVILGRADWRRPRCGARRLALAPHGSPRRRIRVRRSRSSCAASRSTPTTGSATPSRRSASGW